jgi:hypothetical protein
VTFDPASSDLSGLFHDPDMFDTPDDWRRAGFALIRESDNKICVASHRSVGGYLFKKYVASGKRDSDSDQLENYATRVEGARRVRDLIATQRLRHVTVPRKWIRELPRAFGRSAHILIVERLDILDDDASERAYGRISKDALGDLCVALHAFRGLDSTAKNVPFTTDGRIAFIDTEHWDRHSGNRNKRRFLKYLSEHLSSDRQRFAKKLWGRLDGSGDFDEEESTSSS